MKHTQIFYTNSARFASQLAPGSSYETLNLLPSIWQGGGLKSITSIADVGDLYNTNSWIPQTRRQTGSIIYDTTEGKYYKDTGGNDSSSGYVELTMLNGGSITSSAGILISGGYLSGSTATMSVGYYTPGTITSGGLGSFGNITTSGYAYIQGDALVQGTLGVTGVTNLKTTTVSNFRSTGTTMLGDGSDDVITAVGRFTASEGIYISSGNLVLNGGNIATTGTASFGGITSSVLNSNYVPVANSTKGLVNSAIQDNGSSLITLGRATYVGGNFQANGTASATQITASTGFHSLGTSNLTTLNVETINGSGLASFNQLFVEGNTQLGSDPQSITSLWGTLNVVNEGDVSGSITCDPSGNLILDGSGDSSGVQITDGILWLGASGSTGIQVSSGSYGGNSYTGGMISSSMKVVALHGFANRTNDGDASFEVDTLGNLQCRSLKETSLRSYKHEIQYITESQLLNISKLKPVTFLYNQDVPQDVNDTRLRQAGFIAEQVQQIYPEVAWYKDGQLAGLQYQRLTAYLTRGIQELAEQNKLLKSRVQSLEQLVNGILQGAK